MNSKLAVTGIYYENRYLKGRDEFHRYLYDGYLSYENDDNSGTSLPDYKDLARHILNDAGMDSYPNTIFVLGDDSDDSLNDIDNIRIVKQDLSEIIENHNFDERISCAIFLYKGNGVACGVTLKNINEISEADRVYSVIDPELNSKKGSLPGLYINDGMDEKDLVKELLISNGRKSYCSSFRLDFKYSILPSVITGSVCLYNRFFPASGSDIEGRGVEKNSPFFIPEKSMTWFNKERDVSVKFNNIYLNIEGYGNNTDIHPNKYLAYATPYIIPLSGDDKTSILRKADLFEDDLNKVDILSTLSKRYYEKYVEDKRKYTVVLTADSRDDLKKELHFLKKGLAGSFKSGEDFITPNGSYFTPDPLGVNGKIAFVYPGVGSIYTGVGQDIFQMYPELFSLFSSIVKNPSEVIKEQKLYPRSLSKHSEDFIKESDRNIRSDIKSISESGIAFCLLYTMATYGFGINPDMGLGYSMGEVAMFTSLGVWKSPAKMSKRLSESKTFKNRLTGNLEAVRDYWNIEKGVKISDIWGQYTVFAPCQEVEKALENEEKVFITLVNTDDEVVIAGDPKDCLRIINREKYRNFPLNIALAIHSPPAYLEYEKLVELFSLDVNEDRSDTQIYSSSCYLNIPKREKAVANSIAKTFCEKVDFPKLVNKTYEDGARIYIETGPRKICCQWIDEILKDKRHVSVPFNVKGISDINTVVKVVAKLLSHGVDMNLTKFYRAY
ncbi:MAG: PfaB family protein [Deltaproteobacteria bacterium]|nr:PfaB family protein [Deltaproteobacteria bacterium]